MLQVLVAEAPARHSLLEACDVVFVLGAARDSSGLVVSEVLASGTMAELRTRGALPAEGSEVATATSTATAALHAVGTPTDAAHEVSLSRASRTARSSAEPTQEQHPLCLGTCGAVVHAGALGATLKTISGLGNRTDVSLHASGADGGEVDGVGAWMIGSGGGVPALDGQSWLVLYFAVALAVARGVLLPATHALHRAHFAPPEIGGVCAADTRAVVSAFQYQVVSVFHTLLHVTILLPVGLAAALAPALLTPAANLRAVSVNAAAAPLRQSLHTEVSRVTRASLLLSSQRCLARLLLDVTTTALPVSLALALASQDMVFSPGGSGLLAAFLLTVPPLPPPGALYTTPFYNTASSAQPDDTTADKTVTVSNLSVYFHGVHVLRNISFIMKPDDKGTTLIMGDRACGKTTLALALVRLLPPGAAHSGRVSIGGCEELPVGVLRRKVSLVPRTPVLFQGTVLANVDPFGEASDARLLQVGLVAKTQAALPAELSVPITTPSKVRSTVKQLICLARALLQSPACLVLDEIAG
ncbi:hypothetical protein T484DRAFT_1817934 [Baffinella frigidus]|nr:hypothetical protein T484DRAFT_1817934 [Cryptophyta sp. CCMP2293]